MMKKNTLEERVEKNALVPLVLLYPHESNYRSHPPEQMKMLKASLERFGQVRSIVAKANDDGSYTIVAGHGIVQAAQELVYGNPVVYAHLQHLRVDVIPSQWSALDVKAYIVADNNLNAHASDDDELLASLLQEQQDAGYDLIALGSDEESLKQMLKSVGHESVRSSEAYASDEEELLNISEESTNGTMISYLKFGKYSIPLTQEEFSILEDRLKSYGDAIGSYYGFVRSVFV